MRKSLKIALLPVVLASGLSVNHLYAQDKKATQPTKTKDVDGYTMLASGMSYKIATHGNGKRKPQLTDRVQLHISYKVGDSVIFDSRKMNNNNPVPLPITQPRGSGDPIEVFMQMVEGDSAVIKYPVDSMRKTGNLPPWAKDGDYIVYYTKLVSVKTEAEDKKETAEKTEKQKGIDENILQEYFKKNKITPKKTASGLYYVISAEGKGNNIAAGAAVNVNYTGMFLDGKKFDSNTDSAFHHVQPFTLTVGKGNVIKGWDEGLQLLKYGSKARLYIPSGLAYGIQDRPQIPANSILVFDVEIMPDQSEVDETLIKEYISKNKLNATRTASGLYYVLSQKGTGPNATPGKKVTMNYTGKTLNGKVFDSNTDPEFKHVQPFEFNLGQGQVIKGWDEGVQLLNTGARATFIIPSGLGYGTTGAGQAIPPNAVLLFDVELVGMN